MIRLACEHTPRQLSCYSTSYCSLNQAYTCVAGSLVQYYHSKLNSMQISCIRILLMKFISLVLVYVCTRYSSGHDPKSEQVGRQEDYQGK